MIMDRGEKKKSELTAHLVLFFSPPSYSDDLYQILLSSLIQRSQDKEAIVRVQAVIALAKLQGGEIGENDDEEDEEDDEDDEDEDEEGDEKRRKKSERILIDTLRFDPSS